jgi:hypothetical protein
MSDSTSSTPQARRTGLSPKEQKLQALRDKLAKADGGKKQTENASAAGFKGKSSFTGKKTAFQRKAT